MAEVTKQHTHLIDATTSENPKRVVYVVTDGAYSAYHIVAVFSSEEKAQAFIDSDPRLNSWTRNGHPEWDETQIERWEVDAQWES